MRSFTSFSLVISTFIMSLSGFILYVAPPGRIADWGSWKILLLTKSGWQALHTIFSYFFFILVIIHLFFINWKTFLTYIRNKMQSGLNRKAELASAVILSSVIFTGSLRSWAPFGPVMSFGEKVKEGWSDKFDAPPFTHMENYTLRQVSLHFDSIPADQLSKTLTEENIRIMEGDSTLRQIAVRNATTPVKIYNILISKYGKLPDPEQVQ